MSSDMYHQLTSLEIIKLGERYALQQEQRRMWNICERVYGPELDKITFQTDWNPDDEGGKTSYISHLRVYNRHGKPLLFMTDAEYVREDVASWERLRGKSDYFDKLLKAWEEDDDVLIIDYFDDLVAEQVNECNIDLIEKGPSSLRRSTVFAELTPIFRYENVAPKIFDGE